MMQKQTRIVEYQDERHPQVMVIAKRLGRGFGEESGWHLSITGLSDAMVALMQFGLESELHAQNARGTSRNLDVYVYDTATAEQRIDVDDVAEMLHNVLHQWLSVVSEASHVFGAGIIGCHNVAAGTPPIAPEAAGER